MNYYKKILQGNMARKCCKEMWQGTTTRIYGEEGFLDGSDEKEKYFTTSSIPSFFFIPNFHVFCFIILIFNFDFSYIRFSWDCVQVGNAKKL